MNYLLSHEIITPSIILCALLGFLWLRGLLPYTLKLVGLYLGFLVVFIGFYSLGLFWIPLGVVGLACVSLIYFMLNVPKSHLR